MRNLLLGMMLLFVTFSIHAQDTQGEVKLGEAKKNKNANYDIEVNGNCGMCKKRIEKAAFSVKGVKSANWHVDDHMLHLIINEEKCTVTDVKKAIIKIGHDTDDLKATNEDYEKLHGCCLYERK